MADSARLIENLLYLYAERIDAGDFEGVAELFAHGRILASPETKREDAAVGREGVLAMYRGATRRYEDGTPRTRHLISNAIIEVDDAETRATARTSYMVFQQTDVLALQPIIGGHYHDSFHRPEGGWAFDTRVMFIDLTGDLSQHLLFDL
ncbi:MAG: nuclear transport factor 2 family protein [bacterium]